MKQPEKLGSNSSLYNDTKKNNNKKTKKKQDYAFKGYAIAYNIKLLNSFNPEL